MPLPRSPGSSALTLPGIREPASMRRSTWLFSGKLTGYQGSDDRQLACLAVSSPSALSTSPRVLVLPPVNSRPRAGPRARTSCLYTGALTTLHSTLARRHETKSQDTALNKLAREHTGHTRSEDMPLNFRRRVGPIQYTHRRG